MGNITESSSIWSGSKPGYYFISFHFVYSDCEPRFPEKADIITVLAKNPQRKDSEGNGSFRDGRKPPDYSPEKKNNANRYYIKD